MLHELGHALGILMHDNIKDDPVASQAAVNANDKTLAEKCKKAVKSFR